MPNKTEADYDDTLGPLPEDVTVVASTRGRFDFIQFFTKRRRDLEKRLPALRAALEPAGMVWVSWPKKASGVPSDVTEDTVRGLAAQCGLVDVKVCAVDETWSGLKLVIPVKDRPAS